VIPIAHVGGMPVEELIPVAVGAGTALLLARTWLSLRLRRRRRSVRRGRRPGRRQPLDESHDDELGRAAATARPTRP